MKSIKEYLKSVRFSLSYAFKFVPKETTLLSILIVVSAGLSYASPYFLGKLVNAIIHSVKLESHNGIWLLLVIYATVNTLPTLLRNIRLYINRHRQLKFSNELELAILKKREEIDIATYEDPKFQDLIQRGFGNGHGPILDLASGQTDVLWSVTSIIFGTVLAVHFSPWIYLIVIFSAVPGFIVDMRFASKSWGIWSKDSPAQRRFADLRQHIIWRFFIVETKLLQSGNKILDWMRKILTDYTKIQLSTEKSKLWQTSVADIFAFAGLLVGLFLVLKQVMDGSIEIGGLIYMLGTLSNVRSSINDLFVYISNQYETSLKVHAIMEVMHTPPVVVQSLNPTSLKLTAPPEIIFEKVSFKYLNSNTWSLKNVNLTFRAGDNIGLVGNNGAGKTTLVKLLCRIYEPTEGRILINGVDLRDIATSEWWSYLAVMFQDYASYDFVTKDAIAIGRPDKPTNLTKVVEAAHTSQSHTFIEEWKDKYDQQLGVEFGGKEPSKGQRQKLSIAKILYRNGFVMVLDEPTASVDAESEAKIFDSIESLSKETTAILISHDFSTISQCDKIFVLDKGALIEEGDHKELMKMKGLYAELYNLQAKRFKK